MNDQPKPRAEPEYRSIKSLFVSSIIRLKFTGCLVLVSGFVAIFRLISGNDRLMLVYFQTFLLSFLFTRIFRIILLKNPMILFFDFGLNNILCPCYRPKDAHFFPVPGNTASIWFLNSAISKSFARLKQCSLYRAGSFAMN